MVTIFHHLIPNYAQRMAVLKTCYVFALSGNDDAVNNWTLV